MILMVSLPVVDAIGQVQWLKFSPAQGPAALHASGHPTSLTTSDEWDPILQSARATSSRSERRKRSTCSSSTLKPPAVIAVARAGSQRVSTALPLS